MEHRRSARIRSREVLVTRVDEIALFRALSATYPNLRIVKQDGDDPRRRKVTPSVQDVAKGMYDLVVYEGDLELALAQPSGDGGRPWRRFSIHVLRSRWDWSLPYGARWAWDPPTLIRGRISANIRWGDAEGQAFVSKVWRISQKLMTNRMRVEWPHLGFVQGEGKVGGWAGHDALRWCSESPTRMLGGAWRPTLDWRFPDLDWYRDIPDPDALRGWRRLEDEE